MNHELFSNMQKQMTPSPEVRAALSEKLAQPVKKRPVPWMKYGAVAACAALMVGAFSVYNLYQDHEKWSIFVRGLQHDAIITTPGPLHSYVTVEGLTGTIQENATTAATGGDTGAPNTGDLLIRDNAPSGALPGGAYIGDAPSQEEAVNAYQKLMDRFNGEYPDWYGGAYLNGSGWLVVQLVESEDPADKSLELQVLDWTDSDNVMFSSCKYSLNQLNELMDRLNAFPEAYPECVGVMAGWGIDEEHNRIELTLTEPDEGVLALLGDIDPDDDAIYVQVGQRAVADVGGEDIRTDSAKTEDPVSHDVTTPGGATVPEGEDPKDPIAYEPYYDGAHYDVEDLPGELPQSKLPAITEDSVPEEDNTSAFSPAQ